MKLCTASAGCLSLRLVFFADVNTKGGSRLLRNWYTKQKYFELWIKCNLNLLGLENYDLINREGGQPTRPDKQLFFILQYPGTTYLILNVLHSCTYLLSHVETLVWGDSGGGGSLGHGSSCLVWVPAAPLPCGPPGTVGVTVPRPTSTENRYLLVGILLIVILGEWERHCTRKENHLDWVPGYAVHLIGQATIASQVSWSYHQSLRVPAKWKIWKFIGKKREFSRISDKASLW